MLVVAVFAIGLVVLHLSGSDLTRLNHLRLRWRSLAVAAVIVQVAIISLWPTGWRTAHLIANLGTYVAIALFVWANRRIPWLWVLAAGTASNLTAMTVNGGVMPASATAMSISHRTTGSGFANSATVAHPRLQFLGDIIPTPPWLPFHNVASIGDVLIVTGALLLVAHQTRPQARRPKREHWAKNSDNRRVLSD